ncbi:hypothetical protein [Prochlorococcus marinus]|uniref:hypothetical protein n=1 Tax=Prochlorococcus marinus TaxID=1219 RepID=UPI0022B59DD4|nr:hypothetical protein [Prochlorococcus marinus]
MLNIRGEVKAVHQSSISSYIESDRSEKGPERILGPDKKVNVFRTDKSADNLIQQNPFLITSNLQNSLQSIHWSRISLM